MAERKDLLVLAQQKLDEMNRGNSFVVGTKSPSSKKGTATASLLSTLLYMALLSYKVEDMKAMLKHVDMESYEVSASLCLDNNQHRSYSTSTRRSNATTGMGCPSGRATLS